MPRQRLPSGPHSRSKRHDHRKRYVDVEPCRRLWNPGACPSSPWIPTFYPKDMVQIQIIIIIIYIYYIYSVYVYTIYIWTIYILFIYIHYIYTLYIYYIYIYYILNMSDWCHMCIAMTDVGHLSKLGVSLFISTCSTSRTVKKGGNGSVSRPVGCN